MIAMIKNIAWNAFKNTGNINTYLELSQLKNIEENKVKEKIDGAFKSKGYSYIRK